MRNPKSKECLKQFGQFIREAREKNEMTQYEAADLFGMTQPYLSYIERGERDIGFAVAMDMCSRLGVDISDFARRFMEK